MPNGNRTGPEGLGPMSGRRQGYCAGFDSPGYASQRMGRGLGIRMGQGRGRGRGRGFGRAFEPPDARTVPVYKEPSPEEEKIFLENLVKDLEAELEDVKARMKELTNK